MNVQRRLILAVVTDINHSAIAYPGCAQCYTKLLIDPTTQRFHCIKCSVSVPSQSVQWRYRLVLTIADNSTVCRVVVFGRTLETYFGKTATDFHRSLINLDRSGYPAESMLAEALMKTFHGKYFYFGLKLQTSVGKEGALSLADIIADSASSVTSQSMFDHTEVTEHCHTLVYQMIRSNDGVYATVSDFIRFSIKQLREEKQCSMEAETTQKNDTLSQSAVFRCESGDGTVNSDYSLYKSGSFHSKQKSVALSFESSYEESSVFQKQKGNHIEADQNALGDEDEMSSKSLVSYPLHGDEIDSSAWFDNENKMKGCDKLSPNLVKKESDPNSSPQYSSVVHKLDFDSISQNSTCTSQKIDNELFMRAMKQKSNIEKTCLLSSVSMKQCSFEDESLKTHCYDTAVEPHFSQKIPHNGNSSIPDMKPLKQHMKMSDIQGPSEHKYEGQFERARGTLYRLSVCNSFDEFEKFMNMPDSEGLQTFLDDFQQDFMQAPRPKDSVEACKQETKRKNENNVRKKSFEGKEIEILNSDKKVELNKICCINNDDGTFVSFKERENSTKHNLNEKVNQNEANVVDMHLPDSEELENFLASFEDTYISQDVDKACEAIENVSHAESGRENNCHGDYALIKYTETLKNNLADSFQTDTVMIGRRQSSSAKYLGDSKSEYKLQQTLAPCKIKKSAQKGGHGEAWKSDQKGGHGEAWKSDQSTEENKSPQRTVEKLFQTVTTRGEEDKTSEQSRNNHDETGNSCDSGVQLSTSGIDLFSSFSSIDEGLDRNNVKSTAEKVSDRNISQGKVDHVMDEGETEEIKSVSESFEDSWSELLDDELDENLINGLHFVRESIEKEDEVISQRGSKDKETESEKSEIILLHKSNIKNQELDEGNIFSDKNVCDGVNQSGLDSSDILFDTPEVQVSKPRTSLKLTLFQGLDCFTAQFMDRQKTSYTQDLPQDDGIIKESQSSSEFEKSSSQSSAEIQVSELGELKQCRKVMFSRKLRRISSCRLMDITMKQNRSPFSKGIVKRKSCLKSNNHLTKKDTEVNDRLRSANTELTPNKQEAEIVNDTEEDDSFFIESSQKVPDKSTKYLQLKEAERKGELQTGKQKLVGNMVNIRNGIHNLSEESRTSFRSPYNDVPIKHNVYTSHVLDTPLSDNGGPSRCCKVSRLQENSYRATPQNSDYCDSINELDMCQFSISIDKRKSLSNRSNYQINTSKSENPRTICLDSPDIFEEPLNSSQTANFLNKPFHDSENRKIDKENEYYNNSSLKTISSRLLNGRRNTVLKCLASNTPNCDNSHLPGHVQISGEADYFSPDLFGVEESSTGCDNGTKPLNVSSVLRKQLFF